jgi:DNA-binding NtrC family response regulator
MADSKTIVLVGQNLYFLGLVESLAQPHGYETLRATTEKAFWNHFNNRIPALVLVDLEGDHDTWSQVLEGIHSQNNGIPVIAFGPHEDTGALEQARRLGSGLALSKGEFNRDLPRIIEDLASGLQS